MITAYLSLGSNIGDKQVNLIEAVDLLNSQELTVEAVSSFYTSAPVGYLDQDDFVNVVLRVSTELSPYALLEKCLFIEHEMGRKRIIRWGPRIIDIDVILYDNISLDEENLTIPHPRMFERGFVLVPLKDVYIDDHINIDGYLKDIDISDIRKIQNEE